MDGLITLLNQEKEENPLRKHLVVSQFTQFLNLLEKPLTESGFKIVRLDGSMTVKKRNDAISRFSEKADDSPTVMLLSLKAGGVGLNLTAATRVFLMDPVCLFLDSFLIFEYFGRFTESLFFGSLNLKKLTMMSTFSRQRTNLTH